MKRCSRCLIPDTRPDTAFIDGVCSACLAHAARPSINWDARRTELLALLEQHRNPSGYDCIVPSSGGKDSTWQVLTLIELGARPLVVTATTCHLTPIGRRNIDNLARYATTIEVTPNRSVRARLNRLGMQLVGDISWPEHVSIFTTPFRVACDLGIPLLFYGENPQNQYGGPIGTQEAREMTRRWVSEFGGFLGLRPADMIGQLGITERDMQDYLPPSAERLARVGVQAHFLGQYLPWDSHRNAMVSIQNGMEEMPGHPPAQANWWTWENLDNAQTGIHDYQCYRKYGYGRGAAQLSVDIRDGRMDRQRALSIAQHREGVFPEYYAGVALEAVLERLAMSRKKLHQALDQFTNWTIFERDPTDPAAPPHLKAPCWQPE